MNIRSGAAAFGGNMDRSKIREAALECGFKLKPQPGRQDDLNPYVYAFADRMIEAGARNFLEATCADRAEATTKTGEQIARLSYRILGFKLQAEIEQGLPVDLSDSELEVFRAGLARASQMAFELAAAPSVAVATSSEEHLRAENERLTGRLNDLHAKLGRAQSAVTTLKGKLHPSNRKYADRLYADLLKPEPRDFGGPRG